MLVVRRGAVRSAAQSCKCWLVSWFVFVWLVISVSCACARVRARVYFLCFGCVGVRESVLCVLCVLCACVLVCACVCMWLCV